MLVPVIVRPEWVVRSHCHLGHSDHQRRPVVAWLMARWRCRRPLWKWRRPKAGYQWRLWCHRREQKCHRVSCASSCDCRQRRKEGRAHGIGGTTFLVRGVWTMKERRGRAARNASCGPYTARMIGEHESALHGAHPEPTPSRLKRRRGNVDQARSSTPMVGVEWRVWVVCVMVVVVESRYGVGGWNEIQSVGIDCK